MVGSLLDQLKELGIADNTIVIHTTDNGPHFSQWPDGGITPYRSEKNTNYEGAYRVPVEVRWPDKIPAGKISNDIFTHQDWLPTLPTLPTLPALPGLPTFRKNCSRAIRPETQLIKYISTGTISCRT